MHPLTNHDLALLRQHRATCYVGSGDQRFDRSREAPPFGLFLEPIAPTFAVEIERNAAQTDISRFTINQRDANFLRTDFLVKERLKVRMRQQQTQFHAATAPQRKGSFLPFLIQLEMMSADRADHAIQKHLIIVSLLWMSQ